MDISIIIPIFNEQENIRLIYHAIKKVVDRTGRHYELIFIDDGSSDGSSEILKSLEREDAYLKTVRFDKNYGQTAALDAGFKQALGNIVLTIDADLQYDPQDLIRMIDALNSDDVDVVLGRRVERNSGLFKCLCSKVAVFIRNSVLGVFWQDSSLAGYKKECLEGLILYNDTQVFLPVFLKMKGCSVREINVKEHPRRYGKSKYNLRNRLLGRLYALFVVKWLKDNQLNYQFKQIVESKHHTYTPG